MIGRADQASQAPLQPRIQGLQIDVEVEHIENFLLHARDHFRLEGTRVRHVRREEGRPQELHLFELGGHVEAGE